MDTELCGKSLRAKEDHMIRRRYTKEFKIQALELAQQLGSYASAARQLGIRDSSLHAWKQNFKVSLDLKSKPAADALADAEEIKRLKRENEELKKTNYILKRAAAFFSQDHLK